MVLISISLNTLQEEMHLELSEIDLKSFNSYATDVLNFGSGQSGVVTNGRILGPFDEDEDFLIDDFALLEQHTLKGSVNKILNILKESGLLKIYRINFMQINYIYIFRCVRSNK